MGEEGVFIYICILLPDSLTDLDRTWCGEYPSGCPNNIIVMRGALGEGSQPVRTRSRGVERKGGALQPTLPRFQNFDDYKKIRQALTAKVTHCEATSFKNKKK